MKPLEIAVMIIVLVLFIGSIIYIRATAQPPKPQETATETAPEPEIKEYVIYDVPLSKELQIYTQGVCEQYGIDYRLALALMWRESNYDLAAVNASGCYGLMQLNSRYYPDAANLDTKYNIREGITLLGNYRLQWGDVEMSLIAYHNGAKGARRLFDRGIYSTEYSSDIIRYAQNLTVRERIYEEATA